MEFNWIIKTRATGNTSDISITINKNGYGKKHTCFVFRNGCHNRISKTGYAVVAVVANRIYFRQADKKEGYSMSHKKQESVHRFKVMGELTAFIGDYDLCWDAREKLNYIDASLKK